MSYVAVVKRKPSEELQHYKYTKREKVNGKWRYYYDDGETTVKSSQDIKNLKDEWDRLREKEGELSAKRDAEMLKGINDNNTRSEWKEAFDKMIEAQDKYLKATGQYTPPKGPMDFDKIQKEVDAVLDRQDSNFVTMKTMTTGKDYVDKVLGKRVDKTNVKRNKVTKPRNAMTK